jgi:hypothetical protein
MMKIQPKMIAEYLCNLQPFQIRTRILRNKEFVEQFGLTAQSIITVAGEVNINQSTLFAAARCTLTDRSEQVLIDTKMRKIRMEASQEGVVLKGLPVGEEKAEAWLNELKILSPHRDERIQAIEDLLAAFGPTAPDFSTIRDAAANRELTDEESACLLSERAKGVAALHEHMKRSLKAHQATLFNLIPDSITYFERFCGPNPGRANPEEYLRVHLPEYRKDLLRRDLTEGLNISLRGSLRDDLSPGGWVEDAPDDELWEALSKVDAKRDPFSLLGALDIALYRQHDERYVGLAEEIVAELLSDTLPRPDGIDTYDLLPLLADLALNRINTFEGGVLRPPFWKRMCAWMQASLLAELTCPYKFDFDSIQGWATAQEEISGVYAKFLDLHLEPMCHATEMSRSALRGEVIGRLIALQSRHEAAGHSIPKTINLEKAIHDLANSGFALKWALPGPLEGHLIPQKDERHIFPEEEVEDLKEKFETGPEGSQLSALAYLSQHSYLGDGLLRYARQKVAEIDFVQKEEGAREKNLQRLADAGLIAAANRDGKLARTIGIKLVAVAPKVRSVQEMFVLFCCLISTGAAFENNEEYENWLEEQLAEVARHLSRGKALKEFLNQMRELKKVIPLDHCIHSRAEALASAGN